MMPFLTLCELSPLSNEEEDVDSVGEGEGGVLSMRLSG